MAVQPFLDGSTIKLPGQARDIHRKIAAEVGGMKSVIPVPVIKRERRFSHRSQQIIRKDYVKPCKKKTPPSLELFPMLVPSLSW
eukprot:COSAG06_NODE_1122_length_10628_cov_9.062684_10_plen_84_part_00